MRESYYIVNEIYFKDEKEADAFATQQGKNVEVRTLRECSSKNIWDLKEQDWNNPSFQMLKDPAFWATCAGYRTGLGETATIVDVAYVKTMGEWLYQSVSEDDFACAVKEWGNNKETDFVDFLQKEGFNGRLLTKESFLEEDFSNEDLMETVLSLEEFNIYILERGNINAA